MYNFLNLFWFCVMDIFFFGARLKKIIFSYFFEALKDINTLWIFSLVTNWEMLKSCRNFKCNPILNFNYTSCRKWFRVVDLNANFSVDIILKMSDSANISEFTIPRGSQVARPKMHIGISALLLLTQMILFVYENLNFRKTFRNWL